MDPVKVKVKTESKIYDKINEENSKINSMWGTLSILFEH